MKKIFATFVFVIIAAFAVELVAQCPMCRMSLESNLENGGTAGNTINMGILYMLVVPYLLVFTIGYMWYRRNKRPGDFTRDIQKTIPQA